MADTLADSGQALPPTPEAGEVLVAPSWTLQSPHVFVEDFSMAARCAKHQVGLETMQFEDTPDVEQVFGGLVEAKENGVQDVRFHYDRVALKHIRTPEVEGEGISSAYVVLGKTALHGGAKNKLALRQANLQRMQLVRELESHGIADPAHKKRGHHKILSHNHIKIAFADDEAWFGTMGLRGIDFNLSNFMMKVTDPYFVGAIKEVFEKSEETEMGEDEVFPKYDENGDVETKLMLDAGARGRSVIFEQAQAMAESLEPGDEFIFISQWPPVEGKISKLVYGDLIDLLSAKTEEGARGTYLMSREEDLHPTKKGSRYLQRKAKEMEARDPNMTATNLDRSTHAKAFLIKRADGSREVLFGSHNLSKWTVRNGTRELAMWSRDPEIVDQIEGFLDAVQREATEPQAH